MPVPERFARASVVALLAVLALNLDPPPASAGPLVASAPACDTQEMAPVFARWHDPAQYTMLQGGHLESQPRGWEATGPTQIVRGNEPFYVRSERDAHALSLPAGSQVTSAAICVGLGHPTMRFFTRRAGGSPLGTLTVEVLFEDATGAVHDLTIGVVLAGTDWAPTPLLPVVANLLPLLPDDRTAVAFRFTASSGADWLIDDVYVDPWKAR